MRSIFFKVILVLLTVFNTVFSIGCNISYDLLPCYESTYKITVAKNRISN